MLEKIISIAIKQRIMVLVLTALIALIGYQAMRMTPLMHYPIYRMCK